MLQAAASNQSESAEGAEVPDADVLAGLRCVHMLDAEEPYRDALLDAVLGEDRLIRRPMRGRVARLRAGLDADRHAKPTAAKVVAWSRRAYEAALGTSAAVIYRPVPYG
ncbi:MAG: hypothetical protein AAGK78_06880, partial [Planctomycetota bacterium]